MIKMIKNKIFITFGFALILNFCLVQTSFAVPSADITTKHIDYADEFVGKDKYENFNRKMFTFNIKANKYVLRPVNVIWASIMPQYGMDRIQNVYTNIKYPIKLISSLVQKDFETSKTETSRFFINTTIGLAGLYDPALSKFKIEPRDESMGQALAYRKVKQGPFLVLPIVTQGNTRDIAGQILDLPLNPCSYLFFIGPFSMASGGVSLVNDTTYLQPIFKMAENYPDSYVVAKQAYGVDKYIKNTNLDRKEIFKEKMASQNIVPISNITQNPNLKADIELSGYNPQSPEIDAIRSMWFDSLASNDPTWSIMSVWNKSFYKKLKTSSVSLTPGRPKLKYKYILQKDKSAPLAIIYPSVGESITAIQPTIEAKMLYDEGYSVLITSSTFNWEFFNSLPNKYAPGLPPQDARTLRKITPIIINDIQSKNTCKFDKKIVIGNSFGAFTSLFVAAQEEENGNPMGISKYIVINPPIEYFFVMKQLDKYSQAAQNNTSEDVKLRAAMTVKKAIQVSQTAPNITGSKVETLPFTEDEANLAIGYSMKQKLSDVVFVLDGGLKLKKVAQKRALYEKINNMGYYDYALNYLFVGQDKPLEQFNYDASLYSLANFFKKNNNYKIYHSIDDCFVNKEQLIWLKKQTGNKSVYFSNGSHFGALYRKEFIDEFKKDIKINNTINKEDL